MMFKNSSDASLSEVHESVEINHKGKGFRKVLAFFGPAYLVSVGYMDPGNWATDLAGGSKFGYSLIWVLLMSNIMALLLQSLSARLGIVRKRDLAQANRETYPKGINFILYILAEVAIAATDLAEVLGMAIGIHLLTGLPLIWGVSITILDTFLLLFLQRLGMRKMEAFIISLVAIVALSFLVEIILAKPVASEVLQGFIPTFPTDEALYIAIGIIGATVMPHNLYLHSALVQTRKIQKTPAGIKQALKFNFIDSAVALNIAFLVNAAILVLAASVFFKTGRTEVAEIKTAHELLSPLLGSKLAPMLFAIALIAAGQSSTITGTLAGQIVMEGYLRLRINPWVRRLITRLIAIAPAFFVIYIYGDSEVDALLVFSQVILSLQLGFAIIPLIHFVSDKTTMGEFVINRTTQFFAWVIALLLVYLNLRMLINEATPVFSDPGNFGMKLLIISGGVIFFILLMYTTFYPLFARNKAKASIVMHTGLERKIKIEAPKYKKIAIALEFSESDEKLLSAASGQGEKNSEYILIHIVESASARLLGNESDDYETDKDWEQMNSYLNQLKEQGLKVKGFLGFKNRSAEIARIVKEQDADMLVIGAHGHKGMKDWLYGETINSVRHAVNVQVLIVNL
jgi:manganese transport protein